MAHAAHSCRSSIKPQCFIHQQSVNMPKLLCINLAYIDKLAGLISKFGVSTDDGVGKLIVTALNQGQPNGDILGALAIIVKANNVTGAVYHKIPIGIRVTAVCGFLQGPKKDIRVCIIIGIKGENSHARAVKVEHNLFIPAFLLVIVKLHYGLASLIGEYA